MEPREEKLACEIGEPVVERCLPRDITDFLIGYLTSRAAAYEQAFKDDFLRTHKKVAPADVTLSRLLSSGKLLRILLSSPNHTAKSYETRQYNLFVELRDLLFVLDIVGTCQFPTEERMREIKETCDVGYFYSKVRQSIADAQRGAAQAAQNKAAQAQQSQEKTAGASSSSGAATTSVSV